jgi:hypothetical protein
MEDTECSERGVSRTRRWFRVGILILVVVLPLIVLSWLSVKGADRSIRSRFDRVEVGASLSDAEEVLGLKPVQKDASWYDYHTTPVLIAEDVVQSGPWDSETLYYVEGSYWIVLSFNPDTERLIHKELRKSPDALEAWFSRLFRPRWGITF